MFSGLGPSAGLWGDGLRNRSQLGWTGSVCPTRFGRGNVRRGQIGENMRPVGSRGSRTRVSAEMKKDYLPQRGDKTGGS